MFMVMNLIGLNRNFIGNNSIEKIIPNIFFKNTTIFTLINQQKVINQYSKNSADLSSQIEEEKSANQKLLAQKEDVNSKEYIEQTAREKLDMYYPNEKIYIDKGI